MASRRFDFLVKAYHVDTELLQSQEEGKDVRQLKVEGQVLKRLDPETHPNQTLLRNFLEKAYDLPVRNELYKQEPNELDAIRALRPVVSPTVDKVTDKQLVSQKVLGAWLGRCCGCLLGKPVEGWESSEIRSLLEAQDRWPLSDYFLNEIPYEHAKAYPDRQIKLDVSKLDGMPEDDDLNYTVTGYAVYGYCGPDFTSDDIAHFWLSQLPLLSTFTAERVAYANLCSGLLPPETATSRNVHREWIGAQIRADFWGYVCPGRPEKAAEFAWRDAIISHVKNGIYGEMWVAAMLAAAYVLDNTMDVLEAGLAQIPRKCRLARQIRTVIDWRAEGISSEEALNRIHETWDEKTRHHWCHTISNAAIVAAALLWGEMDYERSICLAVSPGFDTDCNGATVGSIMGMLLGPDGIPESWTHPVQTTLYTGLKAFRKQNIEELARKTAELASSNF